MIFAQGTMNMDPGCIADFNQDVAAMNDKVRAEDGCGFYSLLVEDEATCLFNIVEQWPDDDALGVRFIMPWISEFFAEYSTKMLASTVQIIDIAGAPRPLPI